METSFSFFAVTSTLTSTLTLTLLVTSSLCAPIDYEVVDLMHALEEGKDLGWPTHPPYNFTVLARGFSDAFNLYIEYNSLATGEHRGTHADAPSHFAQGHWRVHEIPASKLVGPGVVIDVTDKVAQDREYQVSMDDVMMWESANGRIPDGAVVLFNYGMSRLYAEPTQYMGTSDINNASSFSFPSVSEEVGDFLADNRSVIAVGGDGPSPDLGRCSDGSEGCLPVHIKLLGRDILILENVANVARLPASGAVIVIGLIKLHDGSGAPARVMALKLPAPPCATGAAVTVTPHGAVHVSLVATSLMTLMSMIA